MKLKKNIGQILLSTFMIALAICIVIPFLILVGVSFSEEKDVIANGYKLTPEHLSLEAYKLYTCTSRLLSFSI